VLAVVVEPEVAAIAAVPMSAVGVWIATRPRPREDEADEPFDGAA
jgi:hypothetical protein